MPSHSGLFISFEGTEGAGKTTLIQSVAQILRGCGKEILITREPGGTPLAEKIRHLILSEPMEPWTELFLYEASRSEHVRHHLLPALEAGKIVLCDRFTDSSLAYQGQARKLPWNAVQKLNQWATHGLTPQLTVFLDVSVRRGLNRARQRNRFEEEGAQFLELARRGFYRASRQNPKRWLILKVQDQSVETLAESVLAHLQKRRLLR